VPRPQTRVARSPINVGRFAVSKRVATKYVTDVGSRDRDEKYSTACFHNSLEMRPLLYRRREII
jgi:hypothetical protein